MGSLEGVQVTSLKIIPGDAGSVMHALKASDQSFSSFGEAYFSTVKEGQIKGWKKHRKMILNIVVPVGRILFALYDDRPESPSYRKLFSIELGPAQYQRLTVPPGVWMAFNGRGNGLNLLLNIASIHHDPTEAETLPLENDLIQVGNLFE